MRIALFIVFVFAFLNSNAQSSFSDGYIKYDVSIDSDDAAAELLSVGSTLEVAFKGDKTKAIATVGGGNKVRITTSYKNMAGLALMDVLSERKAVKIDKDRINKALADMEGMRTNPIKRLETTKSICGYECQKILMKDAKSGANIVLYITDKINPKGDKVAMELIHYLKGFPLQILVRKDKTTVNLKAKKVLSEPLSDSQFSLSIPGGYKLTTIDELEREFRMRY